MKKRVIAMALCIVLIVSCLQSLRKVSVFADEVAPGHVEIYYNLQPCNAFSLAKDSKVKISAVTDIVSPTYRWQILIPSYGNIWVDIMNENEQELEVSYALCVNALAGETANIRVIVSNDVYSLNSSNIAVTFTDYELSSTVEVLEGEMTELYKEGFDVIITPEVTPEITPEPMLEPTPEITPEITPEPTLEPTPEITPEPTLEPSPEITPEPTLEPTPEITPEPTLEPTPEITPEPTLEPSPEITPEPTPELSPIGYLGNSGRALGSIGRNSRGFLFDVDPDGENIVYITVNYLNEEGNKLFQPFTAQLEKGTTFDYEVFCPSYVGYLPYKVTGMDGDRYVTETSPTSSVVFNNETINNDILITIIYKPQDVPYGVRFMFQKTNSDEYEENAAASYTGYAKTGTVLSDSQLLGNADTKSRLKGFKSLYHYPESVAADGSTEVYYYFDRIYSLIKFELDGGFGMEPQYGRYGSIFVVNNPTKPGYVFNGWELVLDSDLLDGFELDNGKYYYTDEYGNKICYDDYQELPGTVPPISLCYKAKWTTTTAPVNVVFWAKDLNADTYSLWTQKILYAESSTTINGATGNGKTSTGGTESYRALPASTKDANGFEFDYADTNVFVNGDGSTVVNVYYKRKMITLTFEDYGSCHLLVHQHSNNCYTWSCGLEEHTHSTACVICGKTEHLSHERTCYPGASVTDVSYGVTVLATYGKGRPSSPEQGEVYINKGTYDTYKSIYINGKWYIYTGSVSSGDTVEPTSCGGIHQHTASCYCSKVEHVHNAGCIQGKLICDIPEHTHNVYTGCYNSFQHNKVYTITREFGSDISDIWPIVSGDGSRNYSDGRWSPTNSSSVILFLERMPSSNITYRPSDNWFENNTKVIYYIQTLDDNGSKVHNNKHYEVKKDMNVKIGTWGSFSNVEFVIDLEGYTYSDMISNATEWTNGDHYELYYDRSQYSLTLSDGYGGTSTYNVKYEANVNSAVSGGVNAYVPPYPSEALEENAYEFGGWYTTTQCLEGTEFDPSMKMPSHAVTLTAKWVPLSHTVNFFRTYDDLLSYEESVDNGTPDTSLIYYTKTVAHGNVVGTVTEPIDNWSGNDYVFSTWYYELAGETKAYLPQEMGIHRDMNVYADWSSTSAFPYVIHYVLDAPANETLKAQIQGSCGTPEYGHTYTYNSKQYYYDGTDYYEKVAEDTTGYAFEGTNRTFEAKTGESASGAGDSQLYAAYAKGYFPTLASHALLIQSESKENEEYPVNNSYMFTYAPFNGPVSYTVRYVEKNNLENDLTTVNSTKYPSPKSSSSEYASVVERYAPVSAYIPDAFYKKLILSVEKNASGQWVSSTNNVLYFLYSKGGNAAMYSVHHMLQNVDGDGYTESEVRIDGSANINSTYYIKPVAFDGFTVEYAKAYVGDTSSGVNASKGTGANADKYELSIDAAGSELYIYYTRNTYDYYIYCLISNTDSTPAYLKNSLQAARVVKSEAGELYYKKVQGSRFDSTVEFTFADEVEGYGLVTENPTKSITIKPDIDGVCQNVFVYFFEPEQYVLQFMTATEGGKISNGNITGDLTRISTTSVIATANDGYYFAGWYMDAACTVPVTVTTGSDVNPATGNGTSSMHGWHQVANMANLVNTNYTETGLTDYIKKSQFTATGNGLIKNSAYNIVYARFVPLRSSLKITRSNASDSTQPFVYRVQGTGTNTVDMYVTIIGNGSVTITDLLCGVYTVSEITDWSFRYDENMNPQKSVTVVMETTENVTFSDAVHTKSWLTDTDYTKNSKR